MNVFDPERMLRALIAQDVRFILTGTIAAAFWGSPWITPMLEICVEDTNAMTSSDMFRVVTSGYDDLQSDAVEVDLENVGVLRVASLDGLIRMKQNSALRFDRLEAEMLAGLQAHTSSVTSPSRPNSTAYL